MRRAVAVLLAAAAWLPAGEVKLPHYTREVLPNGIVLYLIPMRGVPLVDFRAQIRGGAESDPQDAAGLSWVTAELLDRGTRRLKANEFAGRLDEIGASVSAWADEQSSGLAMECLSSHAGEALDLLADALLRPAFGQREVRKEIAQAIDAARSEKDSPGSAVWEYFDAFFFGPRHPYGRPQGGDEITLRGIGRATVRDYWRRMYVGANLTLVAAGDFEARAMRESIVRAFGGMRAGVRYEWRAEPEVARPPGPRLLLVDKPDATQTYFMIGLPGIRRSSPDRVAVWLVNTIFGGAFTSMLNEDLRVIRGLSYGAYSSLDQNRMRGAIVVNTYTPTASTEQAIDRALGVLARLRRDGVSAEQLAAVKRYLKGTYAPENLQTAEQVASLAAELELHGLGRDEVDRLDERIDAVTLAEANAAVRKYFSTPDLDFVLVGDARSIAGEASRYAARVSEVSITQPGFGVQPELRVSSLGRDSSLGKDGAGSKTRQKRGTRAEPGRSGTARLRGASNQR